MKKIFNFLVSFLLVVVSTTSVFGETVNGHIYYHGDTTLPVGNVVVKLKNLDNNSTTSYTTIADGFYEFNNVIPGNYKLSAETALPGGGVTFADATLVFLHLLGYYPFTPMEFMASDVNNSNSITWSDYNSIIWHLLFGTPFPSGPWKFESVNFTISPLKDKVPTGLGGTCSGDVGGVFIPAGRNLEAIPVTHKGTLNVSKGETFTYAFNTLDNLSINGTGTFINYPSDLIEVKSVNFKGTDFEYNITDNQIIIVWGNPETTPINFTGGEVFVSITAIAKENIEPGTACFFTIDNHTCLMNTGNEEIKSLNFSAPTINFVAPSLKLSNFPNPFVSTTTLTASLPFAGEVTIDIYNNSGTLVKTVFAGNLAEGVQTIELNADQLAAGTYVCKLKVATDKQTQDQSIRIIKTR